MTVRPRHIPALAASLALIAGTGAHAQSPEMAEAINARLLVGTFGRLCAAPDASADAIEARAYDRRWGAVATGSLGDPAIAAMADSAWRDSFGGAAGGSVTFMLFIKRDADGNLENCGVRYQDISRDSMAGALEASALFDVPKFGPAEDGLYCVATYPVAGNPHEIRLTEITEGIGDGHLTIVRSADPDARKRCPITITPPDPD